MHGVRLLAAAFATIFPMIDPPVKTMLLTMGCPTRAEAVGTPPSRQT
jgi:hypothetical protein